MGSVVKWGYSAIMKVNIMNIFVLSKKPEVAARMLCDEHIVKMRVESTQMLSTCHHEFSSWRPYMCKPSHVNHPCNKWLRESASNYMWLVAHTFEMCREHKRRWNHGVDYLSVSEDRLLKGLMHPPKGLRDFGLTPHPAAIHKPETNYKLWTWAEAYRRGDISIVEAYREFYIQDKSNFACYTAVTVPRWYHLGLSEYGISNRLRVRQHCKQPVPVTSPDSFNYVAYGEYYGV